MSNQSTEVDEPQIAGRVGPHRESHEPRLHGLDFLADGVTPVQGFIQFDLTKGERSFGMACNAQLGCCGFSGWQHLNALKALAAGDANWMQISLLSFCPNFKSLEPAYFAYGIAQGEPGPDPDEGVDNQTMLAWAYKLGLIDGYLEVPKGYEDWFASTFNGALIGQGLVAQIAIDDFNANPRRPWDTMAVTDGHDTAYARGDGEGGGDEITWGGLIPFTPGFRQTNWQDCWVIIDKDDTNVNFEALASVLTELHGIVNPVQSAPTSDAAGLLEHAKDDLERIIKHAYEAVPSDLKDFVKEIHKIVEAAMERESVDVLVTIFKDAIKTYFAVEV